VICIVEVELVLPLRFEHMFASLFVACGFSTTVVHEDMLHWRERSLCAFRPMAKGGHACQALRLTSNTTEQQHTVVVFGGGDAYGVAYNDIIAIEPLPIGDEGCAWRCTELQSTNTGGNIAQRMGHSSVKVRTALVHQHKSTIESEQNTWSCEAMVVFGGYQAVPEAHGYNDVWIIALHQRWSALVGTWRAPPLVDVRRLETLGAPPAPRHSHASCVDHTGTNMLVVGGSSASGGGVMRDCFELNFETSHWREILLPGLALAKEMASCVRVDADDTNDASDLYMVHGGRDVAGELSWGLEMLHVTSKSSGLLETVPGDISLNTPVCCHTTLRLAPRVALSVGGLTSSGAASHDTLMISSREGSARCIQLPRVLKRGEEMEPAPTIFGFGHSSCSWQSRLRGRGRHIVLSGLAPDAASGVVGLFELQTID
jgi:hypothetical protein